MKSPLLTSALAIGLLVSLSSAKASAASLSDCGNIDVEANAQCQVMAEGGCAVDGCTEISCSATLYADCKGECALPDVECSGSCETDCSARCKASGSIDCGADCKGRCGADCSGECTAQCATDGDKAGCEAKCKGTCKASCTGECDAKCEASGSADCTASCKGSCEGSCTVSKNLGCHMACRTKAEAGCVSDCKVACTKPDAALFCDGQYVDHGGNLDSCVTALKEVIKANVELDAKADGSAACSGGTCTAEGSAEASASCGMARAPQSAGWAGLGLFGAVLTGLGLRRRSRRLSSPNA